MFNKVTMLGHLTRDLELKYTPNGLAVARSSIATSYKYKAQTGEQREEVCFIEFTLIGRIAEVSNQYIKKGSKVLLDGRLIFEQWTAQDGTNRSRHTLRVDEIKYLDSKQDNASAYNSNMTTQQGYDNHHNSNNTHYANQGYNNYNNEDYNKQQNQNRYDDNIPDIDIDEVPF